MKRFFGHSPWHAKRTEQSRQYFGNVSRLTSPNVRCCSEVTSCSMCTCWMLPSRCLGSTKWSHEKRPRLVSSATALPHVSEKMHIDAGAPSHDASAASNICTYTEPTSFFTHSSKMPIRKRPHCSDPTDRSVTWLPSCRYRGRGSLPRSPQPC